MSPPPAAPTERTMRLLDLLQRRAWWPGPELADLLGVPTRTLRRDVARLRALEYRVESVGGAAGGYALRHGTELPPIPFTDEEALAVAIALGAAAGTASVAGLDEHAVAALAKLRRVLPSRVRRRVEAIGAASVPLPGGDAAVRPEVLAELALAAHDRRRIRFGYRSVRGTESRRVAEPVRLIALDRRWFLLAWDLGQADWRTFRADRIRGAVDAGPGSPHPLPDEDLRDWVVRRFRPLRAAQHAVVHIDAPLAEVARRLGDHAPGLVTEGDGTRWRIVAGTPEEVAAALVWVRWPFRLDTTPEVRAVLQGLAAALVGPEEGEAGRVDRLPR